MEIIYRKATVDDARKWEELVNNVWREAYKDIFPEEVFIDKEKRLEEKTNNTSYPTQSLYFAVDENNKLIGAGRLAHYLVDEYTDNDGNSFNVWGHTGYGVRPSERKKGYGTKIEKLLLEEAKKRNIDKVYVGIHDSNIGSIKVIENCNGIFEKIIKIDSDPEEIRIYYINN